MKAASALVAGFLHLIRRALSRRNVAGTAAVSFVLVLGAFIIIRWSLSRYSEVYLPQAGIVIVGRGAFQKQVEDALLLLQQKAPTRFSFVTSNVRLIVQATGPEPSCSEIWVCPPYVVLAAYSTSNVVWCAGALVHESTHLDQARRSRRLHNGMLLTAETVGTNAEIEANLADAAALRELSAPPFWADYLQHEGGEQWARSAGNYYSGTNSNALVWPYPLSAVRPDLWKALQKFNVTQRWLNDCNPNTWNTIPSGSKTVAPVSPAPRLSGR